MFDVFDPFWHSSQLGSISISNYLYLLYNFQTIYSLLISFEKGERGLIPDQVSCGNQKEGKPESHIHY